MTVHCHAGAVWSQPSVPFMACVDRQITGTNRGLGKPSVETAVREKRGKTPIIVEKGEGMEKEFARGGKMR